jgi:hypothetical protein
MVAYGVMALGGPMAELRHACYPHSIETLRHSPAWARDYCRAGDWLRQHPGGGTIGAVEATAVLSSTCIGS